MVSLNNYCSTNLYRSLVENMRYLQIEVKKEEKIKDDKLPQVHEFMIDDRYTIFLEGDR